MMPNRAVIFDMDGVIVDSESRHEQAFRDTVSAIGFGEKHDIDFQEYVGRSDRELWEAFFTAHSPGHSMMELLEMKTQRVIDILRRDRPVFDGLSQLVSRLSSHYRLGLASGSERPIVETVLDLDDLRRFFSATVTCGDVQRGKPDPEIFLRAAGLLEVKPANCWVIEDSKPGIAAGLAAGMRVIAIANTHPAAELIQAHHVVRTYEEISRLLLPNIPC